MYRSVFQNSKVALVFAGMTLFSAASMIGTSEDGGTLVDTVERLEQYRGAFASPAQGEKQAAGEGEKAEAPAPVFGEYQPDGSGPATASTTTSPRHGGGAPMSAPLSATAMVVKQGSPLAGALASSEPEPVGEP
jgi:hypothetical protein